MAIERQGQEVSDDTVSNHSENRELEAPLISTDDKTSPDADKFESIKSIITIYADQSGSCENVSKGISVILAIGAFVGAVLPKNPDLPTPWYRTLSSSIGYIYFLSWSVSFYPQLITNYQKKSTEGVSTDAYILAALNYICYTIYNAFFFFDEGIRQEFKDRYGPDATITVQSNDVAFSVHALFLTFVLTGQIMYYGGFKSQPISNITKSIVLVVLVLSCGYIACIQLYGYLWIDFLYLMASVKLVLTILTYLPQIILNHQRKSTDGWNIWNVIFDCMGGFFSMLQLVFDSIDLHDLKGGVSGNWAKLLLGILTLGFDAAFFLQHYFYFEMDTALEDDDDIDGTLYNLIDNEDDVEAVDSSLPEAMSEFV